MQCRLCIKSFSLEFLNFIMLAAFYIQAVDICFIFWPVLSRVFILYCNMPFNCFRFLIVFKLLNIYVISRWYDINLFVLFSSLPSWLFKINLKSCFNLYQILSLSEENFNETFTDAKHRKSSVNLLASIGSSMQSLSMVWRSHLYTSSCSLIKF